MGRRLGSVEYRSISLFLLVSTAMSLASCGPVPEASVKPTLSPTTSSMPPDWQYRWLKGIPCRPPCFEGVTPGQTSASEAVEILKRSPIIGDAWLAYDDRNLRNSRLIWTWKDGQKGGEILFDARTPDQTVWLIPVGQGMIGTGYKLQDIVQAYGQPSHILAIVGRAKDYESITPLPGGYRTSYEATLVWLQYGFELTDASWIDFLTRQPPMKPTISPDMSLEALKFFVPTMEGWMEASPDHYPKQLRPWEGIKTFDYYCRDPYSFGPCQ